MAKAAVKFAGDAGEVTYELETAAESVLHDSDVSDVAQYATQQKLTKEQAAALLTHREKGVAGFKTRFEASNKAPDKYTFELGENSPLTQEDVDKIAAQARTQGLSQEKFAALLKETEATAVALTTREQTRRTQEREGWLNSVKADKELGGNNLTTTLAHTKRAMDKFAPEGSKFREVLNETGFGNHPEFIRVFVQIGKAMSEDSTLLGGGGGGGGSKDEPETLAQALYGKKKKTA